MGLAPKKPGRVNGDPVGSEKPRGKDSSQRKSRADGKSWTPTESRIRDQLMKQFCKNPEGSQNTPAYLAGYDAAFGERVPLASPIRCAECAYGAETAAERDWHITQTGHNAWRRLEEGLAFA